MNTQTSSSTDEGDGNKEPMNNYVFFGFCENEKHSSFIVNSVEDYKKENNISGSSIILGHLKTPEPCLTFTGYFLKLFRQHELEKNERELVLTHEDQLLAVQICLAEYNKETLGDFDVEASKVLETNNLILNEKLSKHETTESSEDFVCLRDRYSSHLKESNNIDLADVYKRIAEEMPNNEKLQNDIASTHFIFTSKPRGKIEEKMAALLVEKKSIFQVQLEVSLDQSINENSPPPVPHIVPSNWEELSSKCPELSTQIISPGARKSVTQVYVEKVLYSYLHLLVNSRSELALARVINIPDRGLDHKAFTDIKRYAKEKRLPLYQSVVSFVMRIRLGGVSYRPDPNAPMSQHVKGLSEFTDLIHKLTTIIEENSDSRLALTKVLNVIKNTVLKSKDNLLRRESVVDAVERIQRHANGVLDRLQQNPITSPGRTDHNGGSLVGRQTLKVLRQIVDHHSSQPQTASNVDVLTDNYSSQRTPLRFPSVLSQFSFTSVAQSKVTSLSSGMGTCDCLRNLWGLSTDISSGFAKRVEPGSEEDQSPLECSPDAKENLSLVERVKNRDVPAKRNKLGPIPRFQANMDWAAPVHDVGFGNQPSVEDFVPSRTIAHPAAPAPKVFKSKVLESIYDQENADSNLHSAPKCGNDKTAPPATQPEMNKSAKRTLSSALSSQPTKKVKKAPPKKKAPTLQKGQKQLTAFFRM